MTEAVGSDMTAREEFALLLDSVRAYVEWQEDAGGMGLPSGPPPRAHGGHRVLPTVDRSDAGPPGDRSEAAPPPLAPAPPATASSVQAPATSSTGAPQPDRRLRLLELSAKVASCQACSLFVTRTQTVFSRGNPHAELCFVGEGPGADEDATGEPFVGRAGQLLDRMVQAMGYGRDEVYICNIVKCRPPDNRKPEPTEMAACRTHLEEQLRLVAPRTIVALGASAVEGLLGATGGITRLRGQWKLYRGTIPVMPTFHPAYLLRNPAAKREVWSDLQAVLKQLGRRPPSSAR